MPTGYRDLVKELRGGGRTVDEITDHLHSLGVKLSRSAVGRRVRILDLATEVGLAEELLRQRRAINSMARQVADLSASIERQAQRKAGEAS